jgi:hypothetical protein
LRCEATCGGSELRLNSGHRFGRGGGGVAAYGGIVWG